MALLRGKDLQHPLRRPLCQVNIKIHLEPLHFGNGHTTTVIGRVLSVKSRWRQGIWLASALMWCYLCVNMYRYGRYMSEVSYFICHERETIDTIFNNLRQDRRVRHLHAAAYGIHVCTCTSFQLPVPTQVWLL